MEYGMRTQTHRREYGMGTSIVSRYPWGCYVGGRVLCSDGVVRMIGRIAATADTFFSIPASVRVTSGGKRYTVCGYVTIETAEGLSTPSPDDPAVAKFVANKYRKNHHRLPEGVWRNPADEQKG